MTARRPCIFVDHDGALVENVPCDGDLARQRLVAGAADGLRLLMHAGYRIAVVSNQSGVARDCSTGDALQHVGDRLTDLLADEMVALDSFAWCPYDQSDTIAEHALICACQMPEPGLILGTALDLDLDLAASWMIGGLLDGVEAGHRAGCRSVLIDNGQETEWRLTPTRTPELRAGDLVAACAQILRAPPRRSPRAGAVGEPWPATNQRAGQ